MEEDNYFEDEEFSPIKSILGLLTFSTILPINVFTSIEYMTKLTWFWPFLHLFVGLLAAVGSQLSHQLCYRAKPLPLRNHCFTQMSFIFHF